MNVDLKEFSNFDSAGKPLPFAVYLYELKADTGFAAASYASFFDGNEAGFLTGQLLNKKLLGVFKKPGSERFIVKISPETQFVGVLATFSTTEARGKGLISTTDSKTSASVQITPNTLEIFQKKPLDLGVGSAGGS